MIKFLNSLFKNSLVCKNDSLFNLFMLNKESISKNLNITAKTEDGVIMGIQHVKLPFYGVQFHPESIATEHGHQIVKNFINCL